MQTPWAIILCKYQDNDTEPYPRQRFEDLFTSTGAGKLNMVDFFDEMSHGKLDLTGSKVFGWHTLPKTRAEYVGSGVNQQGRKDLLAWARAAEPQAAGFFSVVAVTNVPSDLFGGPNGAATDDGRWGGILSNLSPSLMGQEMGHAYGLAHSMIEGSIAEYMDPFDTMSTPNTTTIAPHPFFTELDVRGNPVFRLGPGLNAANMWGRGWLDGNRTWVAADDEPGTTVTLRPLHRRDLPGYLAARVGPYFFEFRVPERWDAGIGPRVGVGSAVLTSHEAMVLVHEYYAGASYLLGMGGLYHFAAGDVFRRGGPIDPLNSTDPLGTLVEVTVVAINAAERTATLSIVRKRDRHPVAGPATVIGRWDSGGGQVVIVGGKPVRIPPRSPLAEVVELAALVEESEAMANGPARDLIRRDALTRIRDQAEAELRRMDGPFEPAAAPLERGQHEAS